MINFKQKGLKCGLLLALPIIFGLSLSVCSNSNALKHQYVSIPLYNPPWPETQFNQSTGKYELTGYPIFTGSGSNFQTFGKSFYVSFLPSNISQSLIDSSVFDDSVSNSLRYFNTESSNNLCSYFTTYGGRLRPIFELYVPPSSSSTNYYDISVDNSFQRIPLDSYITHLSKNGFDGSCQQLSAFGSNNVPSFDSNSLSFDNRAYYESTLSPYSYGADGFYSVSTAIKDGIHYSENFNFAKIFGQGNYLNKFTSLRIPLFDEKQSIDFYQGRSIEFSGSFTFDNPISISQTAQDSGHFYIDFQGITDENNYIEQQISCSLNLRSVEALNYYGLEYSCPWTVDHNYIFTNYQFYIDAKPSDDVSSWDYVWGDSGRWTWSGQTGAGQYIITDNNDDPGSPINSFRSGNSIPNDAERIVNSGSNDIIIDGANFSQSLIQLFGFSFLNPFAPLFQMFSDNNSCANIPTLAGLIHSESTQVCPWFDSSVRNITTPVLGLSSMMLIFGFAVRWLGSRSGNFIEDSGGVDSGGLHFQNKFRRKN